MANLINIDLFFYGMDLANEGYSVREMAKLLRVAKETAHRIQKNAHLMRFLLDGEYKVLTGGGRHDCRRLSRKTRKEPTLSLFRQHYCRTIKEFARNAEAILENNAALLRVEAIRRIFAANKLECAAKITAEGG